MLPEEQVQNLVKAIIRNGESVIAPSLIDSALATLSQEDTGVLIQVRDALRARKPPVVNVWDLSDMILKQLEKQSGKSNPKRKSNFAGVVKRSQQTVAGLKTKVAEAKSAKEKLELKECSFAPKLCSNPSLKPASRYMSPGRIRKDAAVETSQTSTGATTSTFRQSLRTYSRADPLPIDDTAIGLSPDVLHRLDEAEAFYVEYRSTMRELRTNFSMHMKTSSVRPIESSA